MLALNVLLCNAHRHLNCFVHLPTQHPPLPVPPPMKKGVSPPHKLTHMIVYLASKISSEAECWSKLWCPFRPPVLHLHPMFPVHMLTAEVPKISVTSFYIFEQPTMIKNRLEHVCATCT